MAGDARTAAHRKPYRLLWLIDSLTVGGAEALVIPFARVARRRGAELTVCARASIGGNPLEKELRSLGVNVENLGARSLRDAGAMQRLSRLVRDLQPDLIHSHLTYAAIWGALVSRWHRVPLIASLHVPPSSDNDIKGGIRQRLMVTLLNRLSARVIVVSEALGRKWVKETRLSASKITVIHNGIDVERSFDHDTIREDLDINEDAFVIATVAVLRRGKGLEILIQAAKQVVEACGDCVFVVVGEGPMSGEWKRLAEEIGVAEHMRWTGYRRDVPAILAAADLFVLPTFADAFPTVLLEAFAAGLPVVASDVGGVPEIVDEGRTGMLVPAGDPNSLAATIETALKDQLWLQRAGEAARAKSERDFSVDAWFSRLDDLYSQVLTSPRKNAS